MAVPPVSKPEESGWAILREAIVTGARWVKEHEEEIRLFGMWSSVGLACGDTNLYAPIHPEAWQRISEARDVPLDRVGMTALILSLYAPGGDAHGALRDELLSTDLLKPRRREAEEVLDSLADDRFYVTTCGALPLVEYVLAQAAGKWKHPHKYPLDERLEDESELTEGERTDLFLYVAAAEMLTWAVPEWWQSRNPPAGLTDELNRQWVLHGLAMGWDSRDNAIRAVMLVAAAARVAKPLLSPRPATSSP